MSTLRSRKRQQLALLLGPVTLFLGVFLLLPLAIMVVYSFLMPGLYGGVEWSYYPHNYGRILGFADPEFEVFDPVYLSIFARSVKIALITVALTLLVCYPAAFQIAALPDRWKNFALFLITLPFFASLIVRLFIWVLILRPTGFINLTLEELGLIDAPLDLLYTEGAVILGMVYIYIPFMFLPLYASVEKLDWTLIRASQDLGAGPFDTFRRIILPLTLPGIAGGCIIVFIPALGNFIVPAVLGGAKSMMLGNLIEQQFLAARNWPFGSALAMLVMAVVLLLLYFAIRQERADPAGSGRA
ncbi:ABC transporter permease subunit [Microvirga tunisiensis]|uniref:ABC transporter permease subunit n=2 Tax=Pannonibacter tanglangensis TaxID=2750084 RepID=A0A7X5F4H6_9HYPH|nr:MULTISPECIES: ABC transporter permease [unclassified Pannonibacter]NBN65427.1 ABC transporter permease subunit [Pannonibacter sp. XCT-34]NBN79596.1 ABC transporter permease subunit [Pannonibacter sp. XCT-53]